jgi:predicted nuclease with TOPRIM domain
MTSKNMSLKYRIQLWFLRRFLLFRLIECDSERLTERVTEHCDENMRLMKKIESDTNLIESLNRYIAALETKAAYQADTITDLKQRLEEIIAKKNLTE